MGSCNMRSPVTGTFHSARVFKAHLGGDASHTPFPSVTQRPAEFYPVRGGGEVEDL